MLSIPFHAFVRLCCTVTFVCLVVLIKSYFSLRKVNVTAKSCDQESYTLYTYWRNMFLGVFRMPALLDEWYAKVCDTSCASKRLASKGRLRDFAEGWKDFRHTYAYVRPNRSCCA